MYPARATALLVEDNSDHARLIQHRLRRVQHSEITVHTAGTVTEAEQLVTSTDFDVILLDLQLPDCDRHASLPRMLAAAPNTPIIVLTSLEEFDFAVTLVKEGAQDYVVKSNVTPELLHRSIYYAIERKRNQLELQRYTAELERINRELDQFTRVASHDLKSPLAAVEMELATLAKRPESHQPDARDPLRNALETIRRMWRLIDDLLLYARTGREAADFQPVDCNDLIDRLLAELKPTIESAHAAVTVDTLPTIPADPTRLNQLFHNLVSNAIKYAGDQHPRIHISAEFHGPDWVFSVEDNGPGIPADRREHVFDAFTRLHNDAIPGSGLGLSICKRIVEAHGGRIWLDSQTGHGTTFFFNLAARANPA